MKSRGIRADSFASEVRALAASDSLRRESKTLARNRRTSTLLLSPDDALDFLTSFFDLSVSSTISRPPRKRPVVDTFGLL